MKKLFLLFISITTFSFVNAQQFGVKAGFNSTRFVAAYEGNSDSESISGFYVGVLAEFELSDVLRIQPELQYISINKDGESTAFLNVPIMFKYYITDIFNLQVGPQIGYSLEKSVDDLSNLGFDIAIGSGFDINDVFFVDARYAYNINNRYTGVLNGLTLRYNTFQVGVGYKFN